MALDQPAGRMLAPAADIVGMKQAPAADYTTVGLLVDCIVAGLLADYIVAGLLADYIAADLLADCIVADLLAGIAEYMLLDQPVGIAEYMLLDQPADIGHHILVDWPQSHKIGTCSHPMSWVLHRHDTAYIFAPHLRLVANAKKHV
jgi:hypothetical protein